ncbi:vacuolar ATPase V0 domain subunit A [Scheffersomyces xylosifermentans]|uniref:vacuolar ATPase V0 domain subunit A n=1 Tax=Scheffersomyces xylosifermentans TaxID=1304137 RepID=UPI00315D1772
MSQPISLSDEPQAPQEAIFRSAPMTLVQFYVTIELARDMVCTLGNLGNVHFRDLNAKLTPFQRTFVTELRSIDSMEQQLGFLNSIMLKYGTIKSDIFVNLKADKMSLPSTSDVDQIKQKITNFFDRIKHLDNSYNSLDLQKLKLIENRHVLNALTQFHRNSLVQFDDAQIGSDIEDDNVALLNNLNNHNHSLELGVETANLEDSGFNAISGTIAREKVPLLRKILWRTLRGNLYFHDIPIEDDKLYNFSSQSDELVEKNVFIIYIHGDFLRTRVRKIIQSLDGIIYDNVNGGEAARAASSAELNNKINDLNSIVLTTKNHLISELIIFQESYPDFCFIVQREKMIYQTLNEFDEDGTRRCLVGEGWVPSSDLGLIRQTLRHLVREKTRSNNQSSDSQESITLSPDSGSAHNATPVSFGQSSLFAIDDTDNDIESLEDQFGSLIAVVNELSTNRTPPTFHKTNKFTAAFQSIIDAYGVATYQEVNPGLATVVTFPFMFAIMFGDIGHGFIVLLISLYLIRNEVYFGAMRNKDEIFEMAFNGRYIVLLMGIFSIYTGFLYNDIFSKSMTLFKSGWKFEFPEGYDFAKDGAITLIGKKVGVYPFGLDWAWHGTENNLLFTNSYKMKLSVLMGFAHMNYSLAFSLVNYLYFKSKVDIIGNFIPGFLFMQSIFGYLCLTILYKWSVDWIKIDKRPPGLLNMLINMFLSPGKIEEPLYPGQKFIQIFLVLIALVCVPWLLIYKPLTLKRQNDRAIQLGYKDLHSQANHTLQLHEEEEAIIFENDLNNDPPDDVDSFDGEFHFPNDIEPMNHNSTAHGDDAGSFEFGDIVIHQVIHTIEFCLNCVSHTASYLRLWALSLAHAQLSTVLWSMTIQNAFGVTGNFGVFMVVVLFGLWFTLTVCILVMMEGTSAMLHSLRLHWVEAMSKFFEGEGYAYEPFTFESIDL